MVVGWLVGTLTRVVVKIYVQLFCLNSVNQEPLLVFNHGTTPHLLTRVEGRRTHELNVINF